MSLHDSQFRDSIVDLAAPIRGIAKDDLFGEDVRQHRRTTRLVRSTITVLSALLAVSVIAAIVAVIQRREAILQLEVATSRQLAANSELTSNANPQLSALLSAAAFSMRDTPEARTSMLHQLANQARTKNRSVLKRQRRPVSEISFSPDGHTLAAGGETVALWDWTTGTHLPLSRGVRAVGFLLSRGDTLAASADGSVALIDIPGGQQSATFPAGTGSSPIAFSPDGSLLAIGGINYRDVIIWDVDRQTEVSVLSMPPSPDAPPEALGNEALAFSPDGSFLVADAAYHGIAALGNVRSASLISTLSGEDTCPPFSLAISADGQKGYAAGYSCHSATIGLWDRREGAELARLQADGDVTSLAFSPDGLTLLSGDAANHVTLWDVPNLARIETLTGHTAEISSVALIRAGELSRPAAMTAT